ncbi:MAG: hypothetical protein ABJA57_07060 [Ginsengibacter sp.]
MKKIATVLTALVLLFSSTLFAGSIDEVTSRIKTEFEKNFIHATSVQWKKNRGIYVATFKDNGQDLSAAFNEEGELLGASRNITLDQLPLNVSLSLRNMRGGYHVCNSVLELTTDGQTSYCVTAENTKFRSEMSVNSSGDITVTNKMRKKDN